MKYFNEITQMGKIYDQMHLAASVGIIEDELESIMHQMSTIFCTVLPLVLSILLVLLCSVCLCVP